jgi:hypothetical protein
MSTVWTGVGNFVLTIPANCHRRRRVRREVHRAARSRRRNVRIPPPIEDRETVFSVIVSVAMSLPDQ